MHIKTECLTPSSFQSFGSVIQGNVSLNSVEANQGTARRVNFISKLENTRSFAIANLCTFAVTHKTLPFTVKLLEKHPHSSQLFMPFATSTATYLVIVALGNDEPDLGTLKAFIASPSQAINYHAGIWHHPIIALEHNIDFFCIVHEDGSEQDCIEHYLDSELIVSM